MTGLVGITDDPKQEMSFVLDDQTRIYLYMEFRPQQLGWFATIQWGEWVVRGIRLSASPNLLRQYQNQIPFGLMVLMSGSLDPIHITDFADGSAQMYVLNAEEVEAVDTLSFSGN